MAETEKAKRVSFDLRGENAEAFEAWRKNLSSKLGFDISPSKAVLWLLHQERKGGEE
jgi:hypothetical protein